MLCDYGINGPMKNSLTLQKMNLFLLLIGDDVLVLMYPFSYLAYFFVFHTFHRESPAVFLQSL